MASLAVQTYAFLVVVLTGIAWSVSFDLYRVWLQLSRLRRLAGDLADLLFVAWSAALVALGLFLSNWGELRLYVCLGLATGAALYFRLASPVVRPAARWALRAGARMLRWAWRVAVWPLHLLAGAGRFAVRRGKAATRSGAGVARAAYWQGKRWLAWWRRLFP